MDGACPPTCHSERTKGVTLAPPAGQVESRSLPTKTVAGAENEIPRQARDDEL